MTHQASYEEKPGTAVVESLLQGTQEGATSEIERISLEAEGVLQQRASTTGSKAARHAADALKAQRELVTSKDWGDRFMRIANRLEELKKSVRLGDQSSDVAQLQKQLESLRPLMRLIVRSEEFRTSLISALRVAKHVIEQNQEGSIEGVLETGEKKGIEQAGREVRQAVNRTTENVERKMDSHENVISDNDWNKLANELDAIFNKMQRNSEYRQGINQLFDLATLVSSQVKSSMRGVSQRDATVESVKKEAKGLVAQFSGEEAMDKLTRSMNNLIESLRNNNEAREWWSEFKDHTLHITEHYKGKEDIDKYRDIFQKGFRVFQQHKPRINRVIDRMNVVVTNMANDELVMRLRESLSAVSDDLFWQDMDGNRYFDADAAGVLASSISEVIRNQFKSIALPRVERREADMAFTLDDLVISATLPDKIDFHLESYASFDTSLLGISGQSSLQTEIYLTATIKGITAHANNIAFTYIGTRLSEAGLMSVRIPEPGADLAIDFVMRPSSSAISATSAPIPTMRYEFVKVKSHFAIPDMDIAFDTKTLSHSFLVPLVTSLFKTRIINRFQSGVEESMDSGLYNLGQQVTKILNQAQNPLSISSFGSVMTA